MKINRHGQAKILTLEEIQLLFSSGLTNRRERTFFGVMLFTACRVREACTLLSSDVYDRTGQVRPEIIFRKANTKGKLATRTIPVHEDLRILLTDYYPESGEMYLFPGRFGDKHINSDSAARILRKACNQVGIIGASTHSFRRTALTQMSDTGIPLRIIQEVSGHRNLSQLQKYLEVKPEQVLGAIASLSMLSPTGNKAVLGTFDGLDRHDSPLPPQDPQLHSSHDDHHV
jgi:integrase/recombinase XerD